MLTIVWCPCVESSLVLLQEGICYDQCVLLARLCLPLPCFILYSRAKVSCYSRYFLSSYLCVSHAVWGHRRRMGNGGEVWQNVVHWRREWQTTSVFLPWEPQKRQKYRILKDELPRSVDAQYATGDQWRNNSTKNEGMEPKLKRHPVVDGTADRSKVWCYKEQYCIGTWNVTSMNQG